MAVEIVHVAPRECPEEVVQKAVSLLEKGGLVAFPTETVYGVAALLDGGPGEKRLRALKNREEGGKPMSLHLGDPGDIHLYAPPLPRCARRLAKRYWPGSLTLVVKAKKGDTKGFRVPSRILTRTVLKLLSTAGKQVAMPSANLPGCPPAKTAEEVAQNIGDQIDLIIDGGPAELGEASTVVRAVKPYLEILRTGTLTHKELVRTGCYTVLFLCSGNTCRSPMAQVVAQGMAATARDLPLSQSLNSGIRFLCAGTSALAGLPSSEGAQLAVEEVDLDLSGHHATSLTRELLQEVDLVLCMTHAHQDRAQSITMGNERPKIEMLLPDEKELSDPFGGPLAAYRESRNQIQSALSRQMEAILAKPWELP